MWAPPTSRHHSLASVSTETPAIVRVSLYTPTYIEKIYQSCRTCRGLAKVTGMAPSIAPPQKMTWKASAPKSAMTR